MKNLFRLSVLTLCAFAFASAADAIPFASRIAVTNTTVAKGGTIDVSYLLNEDAESVAVNLLDSSDNVVATATGTAAAGMNSATLTAPLTEGSDFRVQVAVTCAGVDHPYLILGRYSFDTASSPFTGYTTNTAQTLFGGFSPRAVHIITDQDSDDFGRIYAFSAYAPASTPAIQHAGAVTFDATLNFWDPTENNGGFATKLMNIPASSIAVGSTQIFDADYIMRDKTKGTYSGQSGNKGFGGYEYYGWNDQDAVDGQIGYNPSMSWYGRGGTTFEYNGTKYYVCANGTTWYRYQLDSSGNFVAGSSVQIFTGGGYSKSARYFDGKVYLLDRGSATAGTANIYRFDPAYLGGLTEAVTITDANYEWKVNCDTIRVAGAAVGPMGWTFTDNGDLYVISRYDHTAEEKGSGLFYIGNASTASFIGDASRDNYITCYPYSISTTYGNIGLDAAGNFAVTDNSKETSVS